EFAPPAPSSTPPPSLHDALPIFGRGLTVPVRAGREHDRGPSPRQRRCGGAPDSFSCTGYNRDLSSQRLHVDPPDARRSSSARGRSEEHTSELQSRENLVCRLLLE